MKECAALHEEVKRSLFRFSELSKEERAVIKKRWGSRYWFIEMHEYLVKSRTNASCDEKTLAHIDFELPEDYCFYLTQIANGGLASVFGIDPFPGPSDDEDDFIVHYFREFKRHRASDSKFENDEVYLSEF